jgi:hypothetical protein
MKTQILALFASLTLLFASTSFGGTAVADTPVTQLPVAENISMYNTPFSVENIGNFTDIGTYVYYNFDSSTDDEFGVGFRLAYELSETIRFRTDFQFDESDFDDLGSVDLLNNGKATLAIQKDLFPETAWFPYLVIGVGTDFDNLDLNYVLGVGIDYEVNENWKVFAEVVNTRDRTDNDTGAAWEDVNQIRLGATVKFGALTDIFNLNLFK